MSGTPTPVPADPGSLIGICRSWMRAWSHEDGPAPDVALSEVALPKAPGSGAVRVLVADDNPLNLMLMSAMLESRGLAPVLAADGAEAVALACEINFDLVLMDLQMPILDGLDATSAIRRFESLGSRPAVPVVAYSSMLPGRGLLAQHGMNGSLAKPCEDQELEDCLLRWCPTYDPAPTSPPAHDAHPTGAANRSAAARSASLR